MAGTPSPQRQRVVPATPIERLGRPFAIFAQHKAAGAGVLLLSALTALVWANTPWGDTYRELLATRITVGAGPFELAKPLLLWINDALMGVFFFVVGLEIKREVLAGELATLRKAALPMAGALGGMLVPAGFYAVANVWGEGAHGWGIPVATDIAFALGILAVLGRRAPLGLKVFLTALAIADDLGGIVIIAVFYTEHVALPSLGLAGVLLAASIGANRAGVRNPIAFFVLGTLTWLAFLNSGVHATLAAVLMAFTIPARTRIESAPFVAHMKGLLETFSTPNKAPTGQRLLSTEQQNVLHHMEEALGHATAPLQQLEHALMPLVTFLVLPVFAFANAGVDLSGGMEHVVGDRVFLGVLLGLFFGKQIGVTLAAWLAVRLRLADLPAGVTWRHVYGAGVLSGIGFTMSLFIAGLAFTRPELRHAAKLGILAASVLSAAVGFLVLWFAPECPTPADRELTS
jgi:NhaA family Na+:H+ antiporter